MAHARLGCAAILATTCVAITSAFPQTTYKYTSPPPVPVYHAPPSPPPAPVYHAPPPSAPVYTGNRTASGMPSVTLPQVPGRGSSTPTVGQNNSASYGGQVYNGQAQKFEPSGVSDSSAGASSNSGHPSNGCAMGAGWCNDAFGKGNWYHIESH